MFPYSYARWIHGSFTYRDLVRRFTHDRRERVCVPSFYWKLRHPGVLALKISNTLDFLLINARHTDLAFGDPNNSFNVMLR